MGSEQGNAPGGGGAGGRRAPRPVARETGALPPRRGFVAHFRVRYHEMDTLGHVNNAVYLHYLEQAAIEHSTALGFTTAQLHAYGGLFIARRHEIDYLRPAVVGDTLQVVTWVGEMVGARAAREYLIARIEPPADGRLPADRIVAAGEAPAGTPLVRAHTDWVWVGVADHRPRRMPRELLDTFLATLDPAPPPSPAGRP